MIFPESPRWLIDHGKVEEGLKNLAKLHAHGNESDPWVQAEFQQIQDAITFDHEHEAKSYIELFRDKSCFRRPRSCLRNPSLYPNDWSICHTILFHHYLQENGYTRRPKL